jgi:hypothetical protein
MIFKKGYKIWFDDAEDKMQNRSYRLDRYYSNWTTFFGLSQRFRFSPLDYSLRSKKMKEAIREAHKIFSEDD